MFPDLGRRDFVHIEQAGGWIRRPMSVLRDWIHCLLLGNLGKEGGGHAELAFAKEMHGDGAVDEVLVCREAIFVGSR